MSTLTKKHPAKKPAASIVKKIPAWIGSARDKISIKPGVNLTKPTFKVGKYFA